MQLRHPRPAAGRLIERRRPARLLRAGFFLLAAAACTSSNPPRASKEDGAGVALRLRVLPDPPVVGVATVEVTATDPEGRPLQGGALRLKGHMSHPGMQPSFAEAREEEPGVYRAALELTMRGDWFIQVSGVFPDSTRVSRTIGLPGVGAR